MSDTAQLASRFITRHIDRQKLSVGDLARAVFKSERQLYRELKADTGMTPYHFIQRIRLQVARRLARRKVVGSLDELARAVGYRRTDHFVRLFRKHYGDHPQDVLDS
jgi:AraC-like DNA-binding protein